MAVSTHGEFCPGVVRVQEWLTRKYHARLLLEGDRDDGEKTEDLTAAFRREFRASLLVASCKGLADSSSLRASGRLAGAAPVAAAHMLYHHQQRHPHDQRYQTATARNSAACAAAGQSS